MSNAITDYLRKEGILPTINAEPKINQLLTQWLENKHIEKDVEKTLNALKPKLVMLLAGESVRTFHATLRDVPGKIVIKEKSQDRRKPDPELLGKLLREKNAPPQAFKTVPDEQFVAAMIERGEITLDEFAATLTGSKTYYPQVSFVEDAQN